METVGVIATIIGALFLLVFLGLVVVSLPDLARYMRVRRM
jgi:hypothetical protein